MRSLRLFCGIIALSAACSLAAHAEPISFTETVTGTGSLGGVSFTNQLITLSGVGDTSNVVFSNPVYDVLLSGATVQIGAGTAVDFTEGILAFNTSNVFGGFAEQTAPNYIILTTNSPALSGYTLDSSISATGGVNFNPNLTFSTASGAFNISSTSGSSTFTATLNGTPEPSSLLLLGTGIVGVAGAARRKLAAV